MTDSVPIVVAVLLAVTVGVIALRIFTRSREPGKRRLTANVAGLGLQTSLNAEVELPEPAKALVANGAAVGRDGNLEGETIQVENSSFGRDLNMKQSPKA